MAAPVRRVDVATVSLWGRDVGAIAWDAQRGIGRFEYTPAYARHGLPVAPLVMPLASRIYSFPALNRETFRGLPGLLADALPDRFGNALIDLWLRQHGRSVDDFHPVERLCYMGSRAMGALEFTPALARPAGKSVPLEVAKLSELAREVLRSRAGLSADLRARPTEALNTIIRIGTSAGGARAKAVIAWNPQTEEVRSGQVPAPEGFEPWLLKFDGVEDTALGDPRGYGRVEYAYHRMAVAAGIEMSPCRLLPEGGRAHFMTRRFDRDAAGEKLHMQSLCALGHYDFNTPGAHGYEQGFAVIRNLGLGHDAVLEFFRRMVFNVLARNQDDHTRNIAFLMDREGRWRLAPAFDVIWAYNPAGTWTSRHQMRINGKQEEITRDDLMAVARSVGVKRPRGILEQVHAAVVRWPEFASAAEVERRLAAMIGESHRLDLR